jgi:hypothetical protein
MPYDKRNVEAWLRAKEPRCPVCGLVTQWVPLHEFVGLPHPSRGEGGANLTAVFVGVRCGGCGYLMLVSPDVMGLTAP